MTESDVLLTIAEIAVAFAGFASLVSVLGKGTSTDDPRVSGTRMRGMINFSLMAIAFSLVPYLLHRYGLDQGIVWRLSSALFALGFLGITVWVGRMVKRLRSLELDGRGVQTMIRTPPFLGGIAGTAILGVNAIVASPSLMPAVYLTGLGLLLLMSGFAFSVIVFSFLPQIDSE